MKRTQILVLIIVLALALGAWYYLSQKTSAPVSDVVEPSVTEETSTLPSGGMETGEY